MKPVLLALLIFTVSSISFAQLHSNQIAQGSFSTKPSPLFLKPHVPLQKEWLPPGYRMRRAGATLTLAGAFLIGGGAIVITGSGTNRNGTYSGAENGLGPLMMEVGAGMIIPGVIFWTKGARRYRIYKAEQDKTSVSLHLMGNGIVYRF